jgi:hypothetical protein
MPAPPPAPTPLGPGTLTFGETGAELDASCQVNNAKITPTKNQTDSTTKLCGTEVPGNTSYTFALTGNVDQDVAQAAGLSALCWDNAGTETAFTFTPNTAAGATATGRCILDPLDFGGDEYGANMTSDFEFSCVGKPAITWGIGTGGTAAALEDDELVGA